MNKKKSKKSKQKSILIGFFIKKLSDFQYLIPLNNFFVSKRIKPIFFSEKTFSFQKTFSIQEIFKKRLDCLFSIDCDFVVKPDFSERKFQHIVIQNYHDFVFSVQRKETKKFYEDCDLIWLENEKFKNVLDNLGEFNSFVGLTPNYWTYYNNQVSKENILERYEKLITNQNKIATCFLPRAKSFEIDYLKDLIKTPEENFNSGGMNKYINHAINFGKYLEENGYSVFYKQRPQHKFHINVKNYMVSDNLFPNESMDLSYISNFSFGYMTSCLMYSYNFNKKYINFNNENYPKILKNIFNLSYKEGLIEERNIEDNFAEVLNFVEQENNNFEKINLKNLIKETKDNILNLINYE